MSGDFLVRHGLMGEISVPEEGSQVLRADDGTRTQPGADHSARTAVIENCKDVKKSKGYLARVGSLRFGHSGSARQRGFPEVEFLCRL